MPTPITVDYTRDGHDWKLTASRDGVELTGGAPGLIAARDHADQLAEKLAKDDKDVVVAHLLDGDALAFTLEYMTARMARSEPEEQPAPQSAEAQSGAITSAASTSTKPAAAERKSTERKPAKKSTNKSNAPTVKTPRVSEKPAEATVAARRHDGAQERIAN